MLLNQTPCPVAAFARAPQRLVAHEKFSRAHRQRRAYDDEAHHTMFAVLRTALPCYFDLAAQFRHVFLDSMRANQQYLFVVQDDDL